MITPLDFILLALTCSLISVGFYAACQFDGDEAYDGLPKEFKKQFSKPEPHDRMILWWVRWYGGRVISKLWTKPLYSCITCMGSVHSLLPTIGFCYVYGLPILIIWPFVALATSGINYLIQTVLWK